MALMTFFTCCTGDSSRKVKAASSNFKGTGVGQRYLTKLTSEAELKISTDLVINRPVQAEKAEPLHATLEAFTAAHEEDVALQQRLKNKVKVCSCGKACGYTLEFCNGCGSSLASVEVSYTDNIFMCFILGIGRSKFPLTISIRAQTPEFICFDDILSMTVCHVNVIPTSVYVPDFRYLFSNPTRGLELIEKMWEFAANVALDQWWGNAEFRKRFFKDEPRPQSVDSLLDVVLCGMNFPPSQYQIHLQFIHPPMLPFHYALTREEQHAQHRRFFPLDYLRRALALGEKARMTISEDTSLDEIITKFDKLGVNYDEAHVRAHRNVKRMQERYAPWNDCDFTYQVVDGRVYSLDEMQLDPQQNAIKLQDDDKKAMSNYGRPYDEDGNPTGVYYKYPKAHNEVRCFSEL